MNLTERLNALFVPSPSPPPIPADSVCSNEAVSADPKSSVSTPGNVDTENRSSHPRTASLSDSIDGPLTTVHPNASVQSTRSLQKQQRKRIDASEIETAVQSAHSGHSLQSETAVHSANSGHSVAIKAQTIYLSDFVDISPRSLRQPYFVRSAAGTAGFSGAMGEDEVDKKFKLHQKSRKRKYQPSMGGDGPAVDQQPPTKRHRAGFKGKAKGRKRGKGKRGRGSKNRSKYNQQNVRRRNTNSDNYSTDVFEDEEDDGSDIDLNPMNSTTSTNSAHRR